MKNFQLKKIVVFIVLCTSFFSFLPYSAKAQLLNPPDSQGYSVENAIQTAVKGEKKLIDTDGDSYDDVMVEIMDIGSDGRPRIKTISLLPSQVGGPQYKNSPFIAQYIAAAYKYAVAIATILSVIVIIFAGVQWTISGGSPDKINSSKQMIARSLTGLTIAITSYALLYTINPDLVTFRNLQILSVAGTAEIPVDRTMPSGTPTNPPQNLASLEGINHLNFASGVERMASPSVAAALKLAMGEYAGDVNITTAYRSPISQYNTMVSQCGCEAIDVLFSKPENKNITPDQWTSHCSKLNECKVGYNSLAVKDGVFQAPSMAHFAGNALDISDMLTGAIKPCGDISVDNLARKSNGVVKAGQWNKDWCIPKQQQQLIKVMLKNGFCVGLKDESTLREPWHFEFLSGQTVSDFCTTNLDPEKLQYLAIN